MIIRIPAQAKFATQLHSKTNPLPARSPNISTILALYLLYICSILSLIFEYVNSQLKFDSNLSRFRIWSDFNLMQLINTLELLFVPTGTNKYCFSLIQLKLFLFKGCKFKNIKYFCSPDFILIC